MKPYHAATAADGHALVLALIEDDRPDALMLDEWLELRQPMSRRT